MLTILGRGKPFCDGVSRREFLQVGALALGGLTLTDRLALEAEAATRLPNKATIIVYLPGGIGQQDSFDLKPQAAAEIRGEFKPIGTNVPGIQICELLPKLAGMMDRFAVIRSLVGARDEHANPLCLSGFAQAEAAKDHPCLGASLTFLAEQQPSRGKGVPAYVDLIPKTQHRPYSLPAATGFLGRRFSSVKPDEQGAADMVLKDVSLSRLQDRRRLLDSIDGFRRMVDRSDAVAASDIATRQAFGILTSRAFVEAMDVSREDAEVRERYGKGHEGIVGDAAPCKNEHFLAARRLVEAGARCVSLGYGFWDWHNDNYRQMRTFLPHLDHAVSTLVLDLEERGMLNDVSVVVWGDFGRTPKINSTAGRDHWPRVASGLVAGGGLRGGQVIGSTTEDAGEADERPIHYRDVMATLLKAHGFDVRTDLVRDNLDRPRYLYEGHEPIPELL